MADQITAGEDMIQSDAVQARIDELQDWADSLKELVERQADGETLSAEDLTMIETYEALFTDDEAEELAALLAVATEVLTYVSADAWKSGSVVLIHEDYRRTYCVNEMEDTTGVKVDAWPFRHIDWDDAVSEYFDGDWNTVEYSGETYYYNQASNR